MGVDIDKCRDGREGRVWGECEQKERVDEEERGTGEKEKV